MKYLKTYENVDRYMIPGYMYKYSKYPKCFIGISENDFPIVCFDFENFQFIEWVSWLNSSKHQTPLNITIEEYLLQHPDFIEDTIKSFRNPTLHKGAGSDIFSKIFKFKERLVNNEDLKMAVKANKFNL